MVDVKEKVHRQWSIVHRRVLQWVSLYKEIKLNSCDATSNPVNL